MASSLRRAATRTRCGLEILDEDSEFDVPRLDVWFTERGILPVVLRNPHNRDKGHGPTDRVDA